METSEQELEGRRQVVRVARALAKERLSPGTSGNVSVRCGAGFLITPSGLSYRRMDTLSIVAVDLAGAVRAGQLKPSTEWHFHREIYRRRPEIGGIVHTHSTFATALACCQRDIPPLHYMVAVAGGESIRCATYATFSTEELAANAVAALEGRRACLLANHGLIAVGSTATEALELAREVEHLATLYCLSLQVGGPVLLDSAEMARVLERLKTYGQQR